MALSKKGKIAVVSFGWLILLGIGAMVWKYWVAPAAEKANEIAQQERHQDIIENTSANSRFDHSVVIAVDSFSGYAGYRSPDFRNECGTRAIKVNIKDDGADYDTRIRSLASGECQMAVFTIDALTKASAEFGDLPGTIIWMVDESRGADAMVAHAGTFPNVDALNHPDTKFVVTPNSPSETLALVVMDHFNLDKLSSNPWIYANGAEEVYTMYRQSKPGEKKVFVLWEPYVSKVLENPQYKVIIDSGKFRDYIVDVMVVSRDFLVKNREVVRNIAEAYFTTMYNLGGDLTGLVSKDAKALGTNLTPEQTTKLAQSIQFKNTQENYAHFGLRGGYNLQHVEGMIEEIIRLQLRRKAITSDPTQGSSNKLYYDGILADMFNDNFHPGLSNEAIRQDQQLAALTEDQWQKLQPVGTMHVPRLVFRRGTSDLSAGSEKTLEELMEKLKKWPHYYLIVKGNSSSQGDAEANRQLAETRANATKEWLVSHGVSTNRIRSESTKPNGSTTVSFVLEELPY